MSTNQIKEPGVFELAIIVFLILLNGFVGRRDLDSDRMLFFAVVRAIEIFGEMVIHY